MCCTSGDTHCSVRGSQFHLGIQHGTHGHVLQCVLFVQCTAHYRGCVGNQQLAQDEKHAMPVSCRVECQQLDND